MKSFLNRKGGLPQMPQISTERLAFGFEKGLHEKGTFFFQNTFYKLCFWVEGPVLLGDMLIAILYIRSTVNNATDLAPIDGTTAH